MSFHEKQANLQGNRSELRKDRSTSKVTGERLRDRWIIQLREQTSLHRGKISFPGGTGELPWKQMSSQDR